MICLLTGLPVIEEPEELNPANRFVEELRGEAYLVKDGNLSKNSCDGGALKL